MTEIKKFLETIKKYNKEYINKFILLKNMSRVIKNQIDIMFPILHSEDKIFIYELSVYLFYYIGNTFLDLTNKKFEEQFTQNNYRDTKAIILMLIPFVDDKDDNKRYKIMMDLNMILYNKIGKKEIDEEIEKVDIVDALNNQFYFSNFSIGLLNNNEKYLELISSDGTKLIYQIIHHNFIGLIETIRTINGKLYVNWINIQPIIESKLEKTKIYNNTLDKVQEYGNTLISDDVNDIKQYLREYNGLPICDFFNVMRNGYYQSIKRVKWLIFNKPSKDKNKYYIQILDEEIGLDNHIKYNYNLYDDLPEKDKIKFNKNLNNFINGSENNIILKQLLIYLINNYKYKEKLDIPKELLQKFKFDIDKNNDFIEDADDEFSKKNTDIFNKINADEVVKLAKLIGPNHIWDYIKEAIVYFQSTIYSTYLINNDDDPNNRGVNHTFYYIDDKNVRINLKNLYNISKLLSHNTKKWKLQNASFLSLDKENQIHFIEKFFKDSDWIKINKNLDIETNNDPEKKKVRLAEIKKDWEDNNIIIIFTYLVRRGLLSEFACNYQMTNSANLPSGYMSKNKAFQNHMKELFKQNKDWKEAYYYLTNSKFKTLDKIREDHDILIIKEKDYFDSVVEDQFWYRFYAMDWLTQINFFHTFINHRVIYVTGSTGQGKSTQVPKLLMYAMKMIDYKENGSVICTQPRIPPTVNNAQRISFELGVPIIQPSKTLNEQVSTDKFYCQYRYQGGQHTTSSEDKQLTLKVVTDGTLFEEIKGNPIMKSKVPGKSNNKTDFTFSEKNIYDIMIIDEAHEHNPNMDMIITLARNACYFNNSLRLVIVSATMDDDEPIYRYYFKMLNDNLTYPIRKPLNFHPFIDDVDNFLPQTIYMDRRFHISPPGESTQYIISEYYRDLPENEDPKTNSEKAQLESYKVAIEICNKSNKGEILLFSTGEREIKEAVQYLNKHLSGGNIALPYFGTMHPKYKEIIEKIDKNIGKIKNKKTEIHNIWGTNFVQDNTVPDGIYTRAIIVATNVAEASVTIPRLEYVIDNGYAKEASYNEETYSTSLNIEMISEASRVQRKGRVGRISDGSVYYMYKKGARESVKPKYKITQIDSGDVFFKLGSRATFTNNKGLYENTILPPIYDPNFNIFYENYEKPKSLENNYSKDDFEFKKSLLKKIGIYDIINNQYNFMPNNFQNDYSYFYNEYIQKNYFYKYYNYEYTINNNIDDITTCFLDGYPISSNVLFDVKGQFHIIHPKENILKRNPLGKIIQQKYEDSNTVTFIKTDKIQFKIFNKTLQMLQNKLILINTSNYLMKDIDNDTDITFKKTLLGLKVSEFMGKTNLDFETCMTLINAYGYSKENIKKKKSKSVMDDSVFSDTLMIIALLQSSSYSILNLISTSTNSGGKKISNFYEFKKIYNSNKSDLMIYYIITQKIKILLKDNIIFNLDKTYYNQFKTEYENIKTKFQDSIKNNNILDPPKKLETDWNKFKELKNNNKLGNETGYLSWLEHSNKILEKVEKDNFNNSSKILNFCKVNFLNFNTILGFLNRYYALKKNIDTIDKDEDSKNKTDNIFEWIDKSYKHNFISKFGYLSKTDKIINSFSSGYITNMLIMVEDYSKPILYGTLDTIDIAKVSRVVDDEATLLTNKGLVTIFLAKNYDNASILINIDVKTLVNLNPLIFNPLEIKNFYTYRKNTSNLYNIVEISGKYWEIFKKKIKNNWNMERIVWESNEIDNSNDDDTYVISDNIDNNLNKYTRNLRKQVLLYNK
jgi:hypothetical protein